MSPGRPAGQGPAASVVPVVRASSVAPAANPGRVLFALQLLGGLAAGALASWVGTAPLTAVAIGLATPVLIHGATLASGFCGSWLASGRPRPIGPWVGTFLREWPRSMWMTYAMLAWREGFAMPATRAAGRADSSAPPARRGPILLLHGFSCHRGVWSVAAPWLVASGRDVTALSIRPSFASIDASVEQVREAIDLLRGVHAGADAGAPAVHIVGHSMGGLVARAYLRRHGWDGVGGVVTLGTPHRGTWQARYGFGEAGQQMRRDSDWLRALAAGEPPSPPSRMLVVASRQDNIVSWPTIQTVPGARQVLLTGLGHLAFLFEPRVIRLVLRFLDAVDCRLARAGRPLHERERPISPGRTPWAC
jgi:triacylglycerol lipase